MFTKFAHIGILIIAWLPLACLDQTVAVKYSLVLEKGRVMDPATGLDAIRNIGIDAGKISAISEDALAGREVVDATGLVIAPGFIDLHAHGQNN